MSQSTDSVNQSNFNCAGLSDQDYFNLACKAYFHKDKNRDYPGEGDTAFDYRDDGTVYITLKNMHGTLAKFKFIPELGRCRELRRKQ